MSSIQERLQLKRVPLDTWNIREQLCLASAVVRSGDQNWMSVSRALKTIGEPNRPPDWYSQKSCAAQYGALLEHVETPKRKKRSSEGAVETPQESILKKLTQERIIEIQKTLEEMNQQYEQLKNEITEVRNPTTSEERLKEIWTNIESAKWTKERENARRTAWLKEREERKSKPERTWRPAQAPTSPGRSPVSTAPPSSPLLTSLLKSSPVVTTPQHISHPANVVETVSPSVTAPTLSMLLEKCATTNSTQHESKHAAIEHIKSQLVQIEQQFKANTSTPPVSLPASPALPPAAPAVDIDDIEIKAEDVYAFRDIDIHIPPVATLHKGSRVERQEVIKNEDDIASLPVSDEGNTTEDMRDHIIKVEPMALDAVTHEMLSGNIETPSEEPIEEPSEVQKIPEPSLVESAPEEVKISFPEVKFPTTEIKVIQPEDRKIKEEVKEPEVAVVEPEKILEEKIQEEPPKPAVEPDIASRPETPVDIPEESSEPQHAEEVAPVAEKAPTPEPEGSQVEETQVQKVEDTFEPEKEEPLAPEPLLPPEPVEPVEIKREEPPEMTLEQKLAEVTGQAFDSKDKDDDVEDSIPLKEMLKEESLLPSRAEDEVKVERQELEDAHTETDDDTPMELSREEEKDGKKKRDYSRKKKSDSRTCSGSESAAETSAPESPSASDAERQHRLWKKSVMLVYSRLCAHKYASLFLRPISDEEAPGYSMVIKRPMDLTAIRKNIEAGIIRTTAEFQRDVLLMLSNALMYNSSEHSVYTMAKEMHEEAQCQLGMLLAAQAHAGLCGAAPPPRRKRRRAPHPAHDSPASLPSAKRTH